MDKKYLLPGLYFVSLALFGFVNLRPSHFATNSEDEVQPFHKIAEVLRNPRCLNCHVSGNIPKQRDFRRNHVPLVNRGRDDAGGGTGVKCSSCHMTRNMGIVPGAPNWRLAPLSMSWEDLNDSELCRVFLDRDKNGNRSPEQLLEHMGTDPLVGWGWAPGGRRAPVPMPREELVSYMKKWIEQGTPCPDP